MAKKPCFENTKKETRLKFLAGSFGCQTPPEKKFVCISYF